MSVSKKELIKITENRTNIKHLEQAIREMKKEIKDLRKERVENQRFISNRRLAIYLAIASILGGIIDEVVKWLISLAS